MPPQYCSAVLTQLNHLVLLEGVLLEGKGGLVQEREREREKGTSTNFGWQASVSIGAKLSEIDWHLTLLRVLFCFKFGFFSLPLGGFGLG